MSSTPRPSRGNAGDAGKAQQLAARTRSLITLISNVRQPRERAVIKRYTSTMPLAASDIR